MRFKLSHDLFLSLSLLITISHSVYLTLHLPQFYISKMCHWAVLVILFVLFGISKAVD